jgi:hypothetical protein
LDPRPLLIRQVCVCAGLLLRLGLLALALSRLVLIRALSRILLSLPLFLFLLLPFPRTLAALILTLIALTRGLFTFPAGLAVLALIALLGLTLLALALIALLRLALPGLTLFTLLGLALFALPLAAGLRLTLPATVLVPFALALLRLAAWLITLLRLAFLLAAPLLCRLRILSGSCRTLTASSRAVLRRSNRHASHQGGRRSK